MPQTHHHEPVHGVRLGVDVGRARVGLAATDPAGILASPVATLARDANDLHDIHQVVHEVIERNAVRVYVGDPINLKGNKTASTDDAHRYAQELSRILVSTGRTTEVRLIDERLSTVSASQKLHQAGVSTRDQRSMIDQLAAVAILEHAMMLERNTGVDTGTLVSPGQEEDFDG